MLWAQPHNPDGEACARGEHAPALRLGCVSYLNAKPLIDGLESTGAAVRYDVPGRLLAMLEAGEVDIALCPIIDYFRARAPLRLVPAGGIGCAGPTLTVRLFSRVPIGEVSAVHGDSDSHTSIALLRVLMAERFGQAVRIIPYHANQPGGATSDAPPAAEAEAANARTTDATDSPDSPEAVLLIGDKVVTAAPDARRYPFTLDLGAGPGPAVRDQHPPICHRRAATGRHPPLCQSGGQTRTDRSAARVGCRRRRRRRCVSGISADAFCVGRAGRPLPINRPSRPGS